MFTHGYAGDQFFGKEMNKNEEECRRIRMSGIRELRNSKNMKMLSELPDEFCKDDLIDVRRKKGLGGKCGYILSRWMKSGMVRKEFQTYCKLKRGAYPTFLSPFCNLCICGILYIIVYLYNMILFAFIAVR